jgi:DNA-directed RNA polymerase subunit RPC12/RpoP
MSETYSCWKCGSQLLDLLLPLPRHEECPHCGSQLHVCRMCVYFDTAVAQQCREPVADPVSDKQRANFCGYFQINPHAFTVSSDQTTASRRQVDALFGGESPAAASETSTTEDELRKELEQLFKK